MRSGLMRAINRVYHINQKISGIPALIAVRRGLINMIPLLLVGSFALIFLTLPLPGYQEGMRRLFGEQWQNVFRFIQDGTSDIFSLVLVLSISYTYADECGKRYNYNISRLITAMVALCSYIAISGIDRPDFSMDNFGVTGVFSAIVIAIVATKIFLKLQSIRLLQIKTFGMTSDLTINYTVNAIYPAALTIAGFAVLNQTLTSLCGISDLHSYLAGLLSKLFLEIKSPFWSGLLYLLLVHIFWFVGMHGGNILEPVARSLFTPALAQNQAALSLGQAPTAVFTKTFFDTFVLMGGCGTTLCFICAVWIIRKQKNLRQLAKLSFIPVIFNINELIIFGAPIVLNPLYIIPFLGTPLVLAVVSYLATVSGLVPYTRNLVEWTTPWFLSGYISTHSLAGSLLQLFNIGLGILCYIPFIRLAEKAAAAETQANLEKVYAFFKQTEKQGITATLLNRYDDIGRISRFLVADLENDLQHDRLILFYQPQVDYAGKVVGVEALLRWNHENYGSIYPPLIIALANEARLTDSLGLYIADKACSDLAKLNQLGFRDLTLSLNVTAVQLESDFFNVSLKRLIKKHQVQPSHLKVEITEQMALASGKNIIAQIKTLKLLGVKLAMDDFGMGHSSLMYLKEYAFDTVKLDGSLIRELLSNPNCSNIISSIITLGKSLHYSVIAEYVEDEQQVGLLHDLGCDLYQGYLFCQAVPYSELVKYLLGKAERGEKISS